MPRADDHVVTLVQGASWPLGDGRYAALYWAREDSCHLVMRDDSPSLRLPVGEPVTSGSVVLCYEGLKAPVAGRSVARIYINTRTAALLDGVIE